LEGVDHLAQRVPRPDGHGPRVPVAPTPQHRRSTYRQLQLKSLTLAQGLLLVL
jgi:hypothetical protein